MNDKIRLDILNYYYSSYKKNPISYAKFDHFKEKFNLSENELFGHVIYLNKKGLLECRMSKGMHDFGTPIDCGITSDGIDAIEHPERFEDKLPFTNLIIHGDVNNSTILQAENIRIEHSFNHVYDAIKDSNLDEEHKTELENNVKELESEIKTKEPSHSKIKVLLSYVRKASIPIYNLISPIIQEYIRQKLLPPNI